MTWFFFFQAEDGIRDIGVTGVQTCALPILGVATEAHGYLAQGGPDNLVQLHRFLSDTVLLTGEGFEPPVVAPDWGMLERPPAGDGRVSIAGSASDRGAEQVRNGDRKSVV